MMPYILCNATRVSTLIRTSAFYLTILDTTVINHAGAEPYFFLAKKRGLSGKFKCNDVIKVGWRGLAGWQPSM